MSINSHPLDAVVETQRSSVADSAPLSFAQEFFWIEANLDPTLHAVVRAQRISGPLDVSALGRAVDEVVRRHEVLRTTFETVDGTPVPIVLPPPIGVLRKPAFSDLPALGREETAAGALERLASAPFDLAKGPLFRAILAEVNDREHILAIGAHHIVFDDWSTGLLWREISALYEAFAAGRRPAVTDLPVQYADFARRERRALTAGELEKGLAYWTTRLDDKFHPLRIPFGSPRPSRVSSRAAKEAAHLDSGLTSALRSLAAGERCTLHMVLLAALQLLLARHTGESDIYLGIPTANRPRVELEPLIGCFVNVVVIRSKVDRGVALRKLLARTRAVCLDAYAHQHIPYHLVARALRPNRCAVREPLFQAMFVFYNAPQSDLHLPGTRTERVDIWSHATSLDLTLLCEQRPDGIDVEFLYREDLFDRRLIRSMVTHFEEILRAAVEVPGENPSPLAMSAGSAPAAADRLGEALRKTVQHACLPQLFQAQAERSPDRPAIMSQGRAFSYAAVDRLSTQLARHLARLGAGREVPVAVLLDRSPELLIAMLAVLKAGSACVPLDVALPPARLKTVLDDCRPRIVITDSFRAVPAPAPAIILLDRDRETISRESTEPLSHDGSPEDTGFVIYTSGTSGHPKGVLVPHRALVNHACAIAAECDIRPDDRVLQFASISFDASLEEIFPAWFKGAAVVIRPADIVAVSELFELCSRERVTILDLPTAYWHTIAVEMSLNAAELPSPVRLVIIGGEKALPERYAQFREAVGPHVVCMNTYGITEAGVSTTLCTLPPDATSAGRDLPIGRPIANTRVYLLDDERRPVRAGVPGEIYIAGAGVAKGYLNRPELTAERFLEDPFRPGSGERMYRSGDLGCLLENGDLLYVGRLDRQIKLRGHRVEPAEIEAALRDCPGIEDAVVTVCGEDEDKILAAYLVARERPPAATDVRGFLLGRLPEFMIPGAFVFVDSLPLNTNGKLDLPGLPAPVRSAATRDFAGTPRTATEEVLAGIWSEVLGVADIGVEDDFFGLGGHSLTAVQMISRACHRLELEIPFRLVFDRPTLTRLASAIDELRHAGRIPGGTEIVRVARDRPLSLAVSQEGLFFLHRMNPSSTAFHVSVGLRLFGPLDTTVMQAAIDALAARQEVLRIRFATTPEGPVQRVEPGGPEVRIEDLRNSGDALTAARLLIEHENRRPFRLDNDALFRFFILRLAEEETVLAIIAHHSVFDAWSLGVLLRELFALYSAIRENRASPLVSLDFQYLDYVDWQRRWLQSEAAAAQLEYWKKRLSPLPPVLRLVPDGVRQATAAEPAAFETAQLPAELVKGLNALCRREEATLFMALVAGWTALLHRHTGETDIAIASPAANRNRAEWERLVGYFVNLLVLRSDLADDPPFRELLTRVRNTCLEAFAHQEYPFEKLVSELNPDRNASGRQLFQVMFVLDSAPRSPRPPGFTLQPFALGNTTAKYDLTLYAREAADGLALTLEYRSDLFRSEAIRRMLEHLRTLLEAAVADPETTVSRLPLLTAQERRLVIADWNRTEADYPRDACVHHGPERQAEQVPHAVALIEASERVTYSELNRRVNRLAHFLLGLGLAPGARVAIFLERGIAAVTAILAVGKAGGVFVTLDPSHPPARTRLILEDSGADFILSDQRFRSRIPGGTGRIVCLDSESDALALASDLNPKPIAKPEDACYLMYTSGSTGTPKGVIGLHGGAVNRIWWLLRTYPFAPGEAQAHKTTLSFIDSLWEIFAPLWAGAPVVIVPDAAVRDPRRFVDFVRKNRATRVVLVPSYLRLLLDTVPGLAAELPALKHWTTSGEAIPLDLCRRFVDRMPGRLLLNLYGCSEASGDSVYCELSGMKALVAAPIGRPIANTQVYILDRHLQPVPIGVAGELYIGGEGVARGYHKRPELTAARFLPDPFSTRAGATLYRTGDLARFLPDGKIDYIGRMDFQVKVRGQRIELGEIEHALSRQPGIRHAVVDARDDEHRQKRLIAYVVPYKNATIDVKELRARLAAALPPAMVPAGFVVLTEMPLTANGKVSRRDLPDPVRTRASSQQALVPLRDPVEVRVAAVWSQALGLDWVGATDDFFEVGGDSLKAVCVLAAIGQEFGTELSLSRFLQAPTVEHTADMLRFSAAPETESLLLPVRTEGSRPPIFCVHPNTTDIGRFDALADRLGPEQPLYGIRAADSETDQEELFLSELASRCAEEVRRVQPRGPYFLAGYCSGGRLAFEIAVRLSEDRAALAYLALLEAFGPGHVRPPVISLVRAHLRKLMEMRSSERLAFLTRKARNVANRALEASTMHWKALVSGRRNGHAHGPESVATFRGPATLFRSQLAYRDYEDTDRTLGWSGSVAGAIEVVEVAGGHEEILKEPFVAGLADQLAARLAASVSRQSQG